MSDQNKYENKRATGFLESKFYMYLSIGGIVVSSYLVIDYLTQEEWLDAIFFFCMGLIAFGFPLIERFKKPK